MRSVRRNGGRPWGGRMTTKSIMSREVVTLSPSHTIAHAVRLMCEKGVHNMPVLDEAGSFVGLFSLRRLARALLPKAAQLDQHSLSMHINFLPDESDELAERLLRLGAEPVSNYLEKRKKIRTCTPDTPLPELLQLLYESPTSLPVVVVEGDRNRLVGMVSTWDVLTKIAVNLVGSATPPQGCGSKIET